MTKTVRDTVMEMFDAQQKKGVDKYGITVDDAELTAVEWITHAQEEVLDLLVYLEKTKRELQLYSLREKLKEGEESGFVNDDAWATLHKIESKLEKNRDENND